MADITKVSKDKIKLELSPLELQVVYEALKKESRYRKKSWNLCSPKYPEELMYHGNMKFIADELKVQVKKVSESYQK